MKKKIFPGKEIRKFAFIIMSAFFLVSCSQKTSDIPTSPCACEPLPSFQHVSWNVHE